jgi:hypothetical protein
MHRTFFLPLNEPVVSPKYVAIQSLPAPFESGCRIMGATRLGGTVNCIRLKLGAFRSEVSGVDVWETGKASLTFP